MSHTAFVRGPLLTRTPEELLRTDGRLRRLYSMTKGDFGAARNVKFDLSECPEIDPGALLLLLYHGRQLKDKGWVTYVSSGEFGASKDVVTNLDHWVASKEQRQAIPRAPGAYLLREIADRNAMVSELTEWSASVQAATSATAERCGLWQMQIGEVTANAFQHGGSLGRALKSILVNGKAYPATGTVQLAALDFGSGIPRVIERVTRPVVCRGDGDLIAHACKRGVTSRCVPQNQGAGLDSLVRTVRATGGGIMILSNNGMVHVMPGRPQYVRNLRVPTGNRKQVLDGTLTIINLRVEGGANV